jgi:hypothetical protein
LFFLVIAWMLGGYVGATAVGSVRLACHRGGVAKPGFVRATDPA